MVKQACILSALFLLLVALLFIPAIRANTRGKSLKILHIASYHMPWKWTDDQFNSFKMAFKNENVEYKVFQMDTKRKSSREWKEKVGKQARDLINSWEPDLVYTNDDNAQEYVARHFVNSNIPFVFSGVNVNPDKYGFTGSTNITGILEQEHFVGSVELLKKIVPTTRKIAVILDDGPTWVGVKERIVQNLKKLDGIEITNWYVIKTFKEYQQTIGNLQSKVDAIGVLGIFTYKDEHGKNVPYSEVLRWTAENSNLPDFSFWKDRIAHGTLCTIAVSGYEQGKEAGRMARSILLEGKSPGSIPMRRTFKGEAVISLARANKLGLKVKSSVLLATEVIPKFDWEQK